MPKRIDSFTDDELKALEDRAETLMREALQRVMDAVVARIVAPTPTAVRRDRA